MNFESGYDYKKIIIHSLYLITNLLYYTICSNTINYDGSISNNTVIIAISILSLVAANKANCKCCEQNKHKFLHNFLLIKLITNYLIYNTNRTNYHHKCKKYFPNNLKPSCIFLSTILSSSKVRSSLSFNLSSKASIIVSRILSHESSVKIAG